MQTLPSSQISGVPAWQVPFAHLSPMVQLLESSQGAWLGSLLQPTVGSHESVVQTSSSSQDRGLPGRHPLPEHTSSTVQALLSSH